MTIQAPEAVVLNEFFEIDFLITSQHSELMDLRTIVEAADNFMVCGESECRVRIAPGETQLIKMKTVGLKAGFYQLPGIKLTDLKTKDRTEVLKSVYNKFVRVLQEKISEY